MQDVKALAELPPVIGVIAGEGNFPVLLAEGARNAGLEVVVFGVNGLASERLRELTPNFYTLKLTEMTRLFELCKRHNIKHVTMAGRVPHKVLLRQISLTDAKALLDEVLELDNPYLVQSSLHMALKRMGLGKVLIQSR